jgi:hypothetical protein
VGLGVRIRGGSSCLKNERGNVSHTVSPVRTDYVEQSVTKLIFWVALINFLYKK